MRRNLRTVFIALLAASAAPAAAQSPALYAGMHWRQIGPIRGGRARAAAGVSSQPNVFYVGFDNGGVWRSTDYGSTWVPLFDDQPTGSIGAIAVAPSDPNVIYVGSGAGIIRPDLATGDGVYKSTDAGRTWTHLGLDETRMIANVAVDPTNPNRLFVAALGHPYGPNAERGIFRSTDGGRTFEKVLYKDEYTSGNDVVIDPSDPNVVYAALWQQQQSFREGDDFGGAGNGIFKSTDGGTTWTHLTDGLPDVIEANLAIALSDPRIVYAMAAGVAPGGRPSTTGVVGFYKSVDGGAHWRLAADTTARPADPRPLARIGGGDLPTIAVDPKNPNVVYSSTTVMWRTEDAGLTWSAVRGAPGGDDYQKTWINSANPDILLTVSDQGAVVSANRGASWSNWYTQPTAAMYHVSTDNAFPYRVCGGQQDSGSGCVDSRSMDGEITFHDWHPVNIQEYGIAAPDPRDPDLVYGSARTNVSLYNRKTGQTSAVGPDARARGTDYNRNVRTMPIIWSPASPNVLFYTSNAVWKTIDRGHSWTRISPDLARRTWEVPASAGKYASGVTVAPLGAITALAPSPRDVNVIWAGTDDGAIQVTLDGGVKWTNVTPPAIKPWTRIFNIDAGHFDTRTAYAAANTLRIDDLNPHLWRTHDGGRTWTEIDGGIAPGAVANSIREDPRKPGLLYASTDTQVWVSFDDGEHWESLRLNMPAISVRDIQVKDDSTCLCADLIAGTHGRGYWILDDVTPLRQVAQARSASDGYLFRPATAVRVRFGTNEPTPWPPEVPAGENPPPGGIIDYYLGADASGPVTLDILDAGGKVVRSYSSEDSVVTPDPALDPSAYDKVCQANPRAPYCSLPLYWPAPQQTLSAAAGMHRFSWDLHFDPVAERGPQEGGATGAVPHRTYPAVNAPWAPPGAYTVRLTANRKRFTQPLTLRLDPRVRTPALALQRLAALSREMYDGAVAAHAEYLQARALVARLDSASGADAAAFRARVDSLAPVPRPAPRGFGGFRGTPAGPPTLESLSGTLLAAAMAMQSADVAPTAGQVAACDSARAQSRAVMSHWGTLKTTGLAGLNVKRRTAGLPAIALPPAPRP
ncbi:MAG: VPS10 domain-containing protein [Gemmatimonadota bacterium]